MAQTSGLTEATIIHKLPRGLATRIGMVCVAYSRLEYSLLMIVASLLQLQKPEARIALRNGRPTELLDTALAIFALRDIDHGIDVQATRSKIEEAKRERDAIAHGIWIQNPATRQIYLQIVRGQWEQPSDDGFSVNRTIFPQSKPYSPADADRTLKVVEGALSLIDLLGQSLDAAIKTYPERFRPPAPILDHLARRSAKRRQKKSD